MKISVKDDDVEKILRKIYAILIEMNERQANEHRVAAAIRKNTAALSVLTTNPPKENEMSEAGGSVQNALAAQTQAIADLAAELATEHEQWSQAVNSGDTDQAEQIVAQVQQNTDQLNQMVQQLRDSVPGGAQGGGGTEQPPVDQGAHPDNTLPNELPVEGEPPVVDPRRRGR